MSEMKLPKAIREEAERADQIERELAAMMNGETGITPETPPLDVPPIDPALSDTPPAEEVPPSENVPPAENTPSDENTAEKWQSRYNALQGKYNAEVPRLHQQMRELSQYVQQLESKLAPPADAPSSTGSDDRDREAAELFGEDIVNYIRERSEAIADRRFAEMKQSQQAVEQRVSQSENDRFFAQVDRAVPNWRDINTDPAWLGWLQEYDPLLGAPRQAALNEARDALDVDRVAAFFKAFQGNRPAPLGNTPPAPSRALQEQVTPRPAGNASVAQSSQARIYTEADIARLLDHRYLSKLPKEQRAAIEQDIDLAVREGRIAA